MLPEQLFKSLLEKRTEEKFRTTFTLTEEGLDALLWIKKELHVSPQDVLEQALVESADSPHQQDDCLQRITDLVKNQEFSRDQLRYKRSLTIGRKAVLRLKEVAEDLEVSRDILFNIVILFAKDCLGAAVEERLKNLREIIKMLLPWRKQGEKILQHAETHLDPGDPICLDLQEILDSVDSLLENFPDVSKRKS